MQFKNPANKHWTTSLQLQRQLCRVADFLTSRVTHLFSNQLQDTWDWQHLWLQQSTIVYDPKVWKNFRFHLKNAKHARGSDTSPDLFDLAKLSSSSNMLM